MDFNDTADQAEFRANARAWLDANYKKRSDKLLRGMEGDGVYREAKQWYKHKAEAGFCQY